MLTETKRTDLFCEYYAKWIKVYCERCPPSWTFEYDHYAKNLSAHHSGT